VALQRKTDELPNLPIALFSLIRAALGFNLSSAPEFLTSHPRPATLNKIKSGIFEAEMVAWNMSQGHVDEFWRIREMKLKPWQTHKEGSVKVKIFNRMCSLSRLDLLTTTCFPIQTRDR
jgi:hypothetical protein